MDRRGATDSSRESGPRLDAWSAGLTLALIVVLLAGWWYGIERFRADRIEARRVAVQAQAKQHAEALTMSIRARVAVVQALARFAEARSRDGTLDKATFDAFAEGAYSTGVRTIQLAPGGVIKWTYPLKGNEAAIGIDLLNFADPEVRADATRAYRGTQPVFSGPYELAQGGLGYVIRQSVKAGDRVWGLAAVVIDVPALLSETGLDHPPSGMLLLITDARGRPIGSPRTRLPGQPETARVSVPGAGWTVGLIPAGGWEDAAAASIQTVELLGLSVVLLFSIVFYLAASRQRRLARAVAEATAELSESERRYRALFEDSPVSLWEEDFSQIKRALDDLVARGVTDVRAYLAGDLDELRRVVGLARILDVNRVSTQTFQASREDLLGGLGTLVDEGNAADFVDQMACVAEGRTSFARLSTLETPGGIRHTLVTWTVAPGHEQDYAFLVVSVVDLTDRVNAERELERYKENLETIVEERTIELLQVNAQLLEAQLAKDAFLASMSHELRTPLNSIIGFTGVLLRGLTGPLREEQRRQLAMVQRSGKHLLMLVNDMLDLAKLQGGYGDYTPERFETAKFVDEVVESVQPLADDKGLRLVVEIRDAPEQLHTDCDRLHQILLNLLGNALKFTEEGSVTLTVRDLGESVEFRVEDTGVGIPEEDQAVVFEPFRQLPQVATAKSEGTGLGLAISRDLAALLGGTLMLRSREGDGSVFTLLIPAEPRERADA